MLSSHRLPLEFDAVRLRQDLALVRPEEWVAHHNKQGYEGGWSGVSLRGVGGAAADIRAGDGAPLTSVADTPILARCPYFAEVLRQFPCPVRSARLLRLCPGAIIREHRDNQLGIENGEVRIHIPILTNPDVAFFVNGERLTMNPGETWYINFNLPHRVKNLGASDRIHFVIDCVVDDWLRGLLPADAAQLDPPPAERPRSPDDWQRFHALVAQDEQLQEELRDTVDLELFVRQVVKLGASCGCQFAAADVEEALRAARREWLERRILQ